jgi:hypothetical protein
LTRGVDVIGGPASAADDVAEFDNKTTEFDVTGLWCALGEYTSNVMSSIVCHILLATKRFAKSMAACGRDRYQSVRCRWQEIKCVCVASNIVDT